MNDLPGDPGLPPGVTDEMTEARSLTPMTVNVCPVCDGEGALDANSHMIRRCRNCNGTGVEE